MSVTKKFIAVLAVGIIPLLFAAFSSISITVFLLYNFVSFLLLAVDYFITPKGNVLSITRPDDDKLYFKTDNKVCIHVRNNFSKPLQVEIKDEISDWHFEVIGEHLKKIIEPSTEQVFDYDIIPSKRGSFIFKHIHVKYTGLLGLCTKYFIRENIMDFKVYPNLKNLSKYRLIMQKNRLLQMGEKRVRLQGSGSEFESLREYVEGDDYRKMNWMTTARENKLIVNQYEAEKNQPIFILVDTGRPMSYNIKGYKKLDYAINAALILSDIVNQKGDNSGLIVFDTDVQSVIMPGKGEAHRNHLMETLYHIEDTKNTSDYESVFRELNAKQKRRSLVFIFTDFETLEEANDLMNHVSSISRRHIPLIILMKNESLLKITDGPDHKTSEIFQKGMAYEFLEEHRNIIKTLNLKGVLCVESSSENFALDTVNYYLSIKNKNMI